MRSLTEGLPLSVTTVLVPVLESEAEALLAGQPTPELLPRAERLRRRVARVDGIREPLHELLYPRWEKEAGKHGIGGRRRSDHPFSRFTKLFAPKAEPPRIPSGYDPYVHLFGRTFPLFRTAPRELAPRLIELLQADNQAFSAELKKELQQLDSRGIELYDQATASFDSTELVRSVQRVQDKLTAAIGATLNARAAYDALVTLSAWSQPVWRLDGDMLRELTRTLGITEAPGRAVSLFDELKDARPDIEPALKKLPDHLQDFAGAGAFWSSTEVKAVAGSMRLYRSKLARNAVENGEDPIATLRNLRLLEEAVLFCEAESLALAEAAGVEWHDRPK
jgi:hypothetical protein